MAIVRALSQHSTLQQLDLQDNNIGLADVAAIEQSLDRSFLRLNAHFPEVLFDTVLQTWKYRFLCALSNKGFRSFIQNDVPPALWPHALAGIPR
jgi:hypothetical protein